MPLCNKPRQLPLHCVMQDITLLAHSVISPPSLGRANSSHHSASRCTGTYHERGRQVIQYKDPRRQVFLQDIASPIRTPTASVRSLSLSQLITSCLVYSGMVRK